MISKNFAFWLVAVFSFIGMIYNLVLDEIIISILLGINFFICGVMYYKYRKRGE